MLIRPYFAKIELFQVLQDMPLFKKAQTINLQNERDTVNDELLGAEALLQSEGAMTPEAQVSIQKMKEDLQRISDDLASGNTSNLDNSIALVETIQKMVEKAKIARVKGIFQDDQIQELLIQIQQMFQVIERRMKVDTDFVITLSAKDREILDFVRNDPLFSENPLFQLNNRFWLKQQIQNGVAPADQQEALDQDEVKIFIAFQHLNLIVKRAADSA